VYLFWLPEIIFSSYGYPKVAVSDRVAIEKSVGFQLAVPMSLDSIRNNYAQLLFQEVYCFKKLTSVLTKFETSVYYCNPGGTIIQFWRNSY